MFSSQRLDLPEIPRVTGNRAGRGSSELRVSKRLKEIRLSLTVLILALAGIVTGRAADLPYRYLFLVDVSRSMAPHRASAARFVGEATRGDFEGFARPGHVVGLWMVNDRLRRDARPAEFWNVHQKNRIAAEMQALLEAEPHDRVLRTRLLADAIAEVAGRSQVLTLFLLSTSDRKIKGTPFDSLINETYAKAPRTRSAAAPAVITKLVAQNGQWTGWSVHALLEAPDAVSARNLAGSPILPLLPGANPPETPAESESEEAPALLPELRLPPPPELSADLTKPLSVPALSHDERNGGAPRRNPVLVAIPSTRLADKTSAPTNQPPVTPETEVDRAEANPPESAAKAESAPEKASLTSVVKKDFLQMAPESPSAGVAPRTVVGETNEATLADAVANRPNPALPAHDYSEKNRRTEIETPDEPWMNVASDPEARAYEEMDAEAPSGTNAKSSLLAIVSLYGGAGLMVLAGCWVLLARRKSRAGPKISLISKSMSPE